MHQVHTNQKVDIMNENGEIVEANVPIDRIRVVAPVKRKLQSRTKTKKTQKVQSTH